MENRNKDRDAGTGKAESLPPQGGADWSPVPRPGEPRPLTKMDWMTGNPFRYERGVELHPPATVDFYRDLR